MLPAGLAITGFFLACASAACESGSNLTSSSAPQSAELPTGQALAVDATPSGAIVDRIRGPFALFPDFDRQLIFSIGLVTPIEEACAGAELVADGKIQDTFITLPSGLVHGLLTTTKATLVVYGRATEDPCELTEADVLARGTGRLVFHTNNVFEDESQDTKAGYIVTGDVTLPDGRRAHLHARLRLRIVDGDFRVLAEEFTLRPIGG
jgi:hypothetical protein